MRYELAHALAALRPGEAWSLAGNEDLSGLSWHHESEPPTEQEVMDKLADMRAKEPQRLLRIERDKRLAEVDWVAIRSMAQGTEIPQEWKDYMQALRDLPINASPSIKDTDLMGDLDISSVEWPQKPV